MFIRPLLVIGVKSLVQEKSILTVYTVEKNRIDGLETWDEI